jgi:hypothetical protein
MIHSSSVATTRFQEWNSGAVDLVAGAARAACDITSSRDAARK